MGYHFSRLATIRYTTVFHIINIIYCQLQRFNTVTLVERMIEFSLKSSEVVFTVFWLTAFVAFTGFKIGTRRVASQFFLVSSDSQIDEALADPIIFRIISSKSK